MTVSPTRPLLPSQRQGAWPAPRVCQAALGDDLSAKQAADIAYSLRLGCIVLVRSDNLVAAVIDPLSAPGVAALRAVVATAEPFSLSCLGRVQAEYWLRLTNLDHRLIDQ